MSKTIMIDIGHGGTDSGASAFGVREKDWNLKMGLLVIFISPFVVSKIKFSVIVSPAQEKINIYASCEERIFLSPVDFCLSVCYNTQNQKGEQYYGCKNH